MNETHGFILVGGAGARLGGAKPDTVLDGLTLQERAIATLQECTAEVTLVGRPHSLESGRITIPDRAHGEGPLGALATALGYTRRKAAFVLACDFPLVTPELIRGIIDGLEGHDASVPAGATGLQSLCAAYRPSILPEIDKLLSQGVRTVQRILPRIHCHYLSQARLSRLGDEGRQFLNINAPRDLIRARGYLASA